MLTRASSTKHDGSLTSLAGQHTRSVLSGLFLTFVTVGNMICCCLNLSWDGLVNEASSIAPFHYCAGKRPSWTGPSFLAAVAGVPPIGENCWLAVGVPCFSIR
jgi:hypothetical protein